MSGRTLIELAFRSPCLSGVRGVRLKSQTTHVDADVGLPSDAGSIPAASTILRLLGELRMAFHIQ